MKQQLARTTSQQFLLLAILAVLATVATNPLGNFPLNDDWQYAYPVRALMEHGELEFKGIFAPNVLAQIGWGWLFCKLAGNFDFIWLRLSTLASGAAAIWAFCRLGSSLCIPQQGLWPISLLMAFTPLFYSLSFTFMSDVPFLALCLLALLAFQRYMASERAGWLVAASAWAIASYLVRQPGLLLLPCFAIALFYRRPSAKNGAWTLVLLALAAGSYFGLEHWAKPALGISGNYVPVSDRYADALLRHPLHTATEWGKKLLKTFVYLGVFALPLLPFLWQKLRDHQLIRPRFLLLATALNLLLLAGMVHTGKVFPFGGNVLFNLGLGPELLADTYTHGLPHTPHLPSWTMLIVSLAGQLSATLLLALLTKGWKSLAAPQRRFARLLFLLNALYLPAMSITSFFDRYLLLPLASLLLLLGFFFEKNGEKPNWLKWLPMTVMCWFSIAATHDYLAWNRARLAAYEQLQVQGIGIQQMDAGYELNGFYNYHLVRREVPGRSFWWVTDDEWLIAFGPVPGYKVQGQVPYHRWLFFRSDKLLILRKEG